MKSTQRAALAACVLLPLAGGIAYHLHGEGNTPAATTQPPAQVRALQVPIGFEANRGQTDDAVDYVARGPGYSLFLTASEAVFRLVAPSAHASQSTVLRLSLVGANKAPVAQGVDPQDGVSHYITGAASHSAERFGKVRYTGVYPGIDVVYYGNQRELEYDFVVAPGADPRRIGLRFGGTNAVKLDASGNLVLSTAGGNVVQHKPVAYQTIDGQRRAVDSRYRVLADNSVAFEVGAYDRAHALVIDPVVVYRASLNGAGADNAYKIAVDAAGNTYLTGTTDSLDFPVTDGAQQAERAGDVDAFVAKLNAAGNAVVWSTYLGGSALDEGRGIAVDADGTVVVSGNTKSTDFPVVNALRSTFQGGGADGFLSRLSSDGSTLVSSTYLGGTNFDGSNDVALDADGNAYVTGNTQSVDFPITPGAALPTNATGINGYLTKFAPDGAVVYSTYTTGAMSTIAVDRQGSAYVAGFNATIRKFSPAGDAVVYSMRLNTFAQSISEIAVDDDGAVYALGADAARSTPIINSSLNQYTGTFLCKFDPTGTIIVFCGYVGEPGDFASNGLVQGVDSIAVDKDGMVNVVGWNNHHAPLVYDAFVQRILPSGHNQRDFVYVGASRDDTVMQTANDIALDRDGNAYVGGSGRNDADYHGFLARVMPVDWKIIGAGDLNADGRADLLWHNRGKQQLDWWRMQAASRVAFGSASIPSQFSVVAVADFNGDKRTDVLWRDQAQSQVWLWQTEADGSFSIHYVADHPARGWEVAGAADVDGDGRADILWHNRKLQELDWWLMDGATLRAVGGQYVPSQYSVAGIADFTGDGRADLVWQDDARTTLWLWHPAVYDFAVSYIGAYPPAGWKIVGAGDLDGDRRADLLWHNASLQQLDWWKMQGAVRVGIGSKFIPSMYRVDAVADFDGDGRTDIVWRDDDRTTLWLWRAIPNDFAVQFIDNHPQGQ